MTNQFRPSEGPESFAHERSTPQQRIAMCIDLLDASEELLLAGLRREVGPDGNVRAAYRSWCENQREEHDRMIRRMAMRLHERGVRHGR